jgi:hypothetical protein
MRIEACLVARRSTSAAVIGDAVFGEELARLVYQAARRHWHAYATREQPA